MSVLIVVSMKQFKLSCTGTGSQIVVLSKVTTILCHDVYFKSLKAFLSATMTKVFLLFRFGNVGTCLHSNHSCSHDGGGKVKHVKVFLPFADHIPL